jgi:hypothetical protein
MMRAHSWRLLLSPTRVRGTFSQQVCLPLVGLAPAPVSPDRQWLHDVILKDIDVVTT